MATFEEDVIAKYQDVFYGLMWWLNLPANFKRSNMDAPFCIMQITGGKYRLYVDNTEHEFLNAVVRFTVWGADTIQVSQRMRTLIETIIASGTAEWIVIPEGAAIDDNDETLRLVGKHQEIGFWFKNPSYVSP